MRQFSWILAGALAACLPIASRPSLAQAKAAPVSDAQVESDVLRALAGDARLADQAISSDTVYGVVTLSGTVRDEDSRKLAETVVSRTRGVQKVIDELTLATNARPGTSETARNSASAAPEDGGSNPLLQSDGTLAPAQQSSASSEPAGPDQPSYPQPQADQEARQGVRQPPYGQQSSYPEQPPYPQDPQSSRQPSRPPQPPYTQPYDPYGRTDSPGTGGHDQQDQPPYGPAPYNRPSGYPARPAPYGAHFGGQPVTVSPGSMLRIRISQGLDSQHTQPGTVFDAVVLNDVVADGYVAIPRGATVQGTVVESQRAGALGALKGRGELALQLTGVTLAGRTYPLSTDVWSNVGGDKTGRTVGSAVGLGAVGAVIGGVTGGGAGAAIGAGVGGAAGVGASAASGGGQAFIPDEAILTFHLKQPAAIATVSQTEMDRLGYGVPPPEPIRRRYVRPPAPYGYPVPYPRAPYPYPYAY